MSVIKDSPGIAPEYPDTEVRPAAEIGWSEGVLSDGRPWLASLWEDDDGDRTLSITYPSAECEEDDDEYQMIQRLLDEELIVPLGEEIEYFVAEKRDDLFSPAPIWMIDILLSNPENEWAKPGFPVRDLKEYRLH
jgi:hypothetical protein